MCFEHMISLETVVIGKNVKEMNGNPFYLCRNLISVTIHEENVNVIDGRNVVDCSRNCENYGKYN